MGNPNPTKKLTPARSNAIYDAICAGLTRSQSAAAASVAPSTLYAWIAAGRAGTNPAAVALIRRIEEGEAKFARELIAAMRKATPDDWRAAEALLKRRFPNEYSERQEVTGAAGGPLEVKLAFDPTPKPDGGTDAADPQV